MSLVPERWRLLYNLNTMAGVIEGSRCALLGTQSPAMWIIALNAIVVLVLLLGGLLYFRQTEKTFARLCLSFPGRKR